MATIFQPILDCKQRALYAYPTAPIKERISEYNRQLRESVEPELYVRYCINQCDIYVDTYMIIVATQNVYPDVSAETIYDWIDKHKEKHHYLIA